MMKTKLDQILSLNRLTLNCLINESNGNSLEELELPYDDLFKDSENCGPKALDGVAKRVNSSCTKKPAKEQFQSIQRKYQRLENCEFPKTPRVNPDLWDDLHDKTKSLEVLLRAFQKNLIKGIILHGNYAHR